MGVTFADLQANTRHQSPLLFLFTPLEELAISCGLCAADAVLVIS